MLKKTGCSVAFFLMIFSAIMVPGAKAEGTAGDYFYEIGTKIGRGFENILTSPADIPCTMKTEIQSQGGMGGVTGFGKGTLFMLRRMLVGVCEVVTFVIPMERTIPPVCQESKAAVV